MDAIAELSRVSKATIYKHWADKDALCLEAVVRLFGLDQERPSFDSGDLRKDLLDCVNYRAAPEMAGTQSQIAPHIWAYGARNRQFGEAWRDKLIRPSRVQLVALLTRAIEAGHLSGTLHPEVGVAILIGSQMYSRIFTSLQEMLPSNLSEILVDALIRAYSPTWGKHAD